METSLLSCAQEPAGCLPAVRGLTASWQGTDVWILDSFTRRGCAKNDVAELRPWKTGEWILGQVTTCSTSDLKLVRLQHEVVELKGGRVVLREFQPSADPVNAVHSIREKADAVAAAAAPSEPAFLSLKTEAINCHAVKPEGALAHEKMHPTHAVRPRSDRKRYELCFDVPHVQVWDMTPWRCRHCESETWHITSSDIDAECTRLGIGRVILGKDPRHGKLHATPMMLFWLLLIFYSKLNLRAVRRSVLDLYSATVLHAARASPSLVDGVQLRWILMGLPATEAIKNLLLKYFAGFVQKRVDIMQRRQFLYNGQLIRGDGNYSLSKSVFSVVDGAKVRKFTVALAWCGVDGSLLAPVSVAAGESWPCIEADLKPLLQKIKQTRLEAGFSLEESLPCFHATDSYHKHRAKISKLYGKVWQDLRAQGQSSTPCRDAFGQVEVSSEDASRVHWLFRVTGEPMHDLFNLRRLASPAANDCRTFLKDHEDLILRLSAPPAPQQVAEARHGACLTDVEEIALSPAAAELLAVCVQETVARASEHALASPAAAQELRAMLGNEEAQNHLVWGELFGASPPRGVLRRTAKCLKADLHLKYGFFNFSGRQDFLEEVERLEAWYKEPKRKSRQRRGIVRSQTSSKEVKGLARVWTTKVAAHYSRLKAPVRVQGLMRWREAALALHAAGIQVHSGTIPVERLWSNIGKYFPKEATSISEEWWGFLSNLAYLRFNYRHFHKQGLPPWAREDALVHEHVESIMKIAEAVVFPSSPGHCLARELDAWVKEVSAQAARSGYEAESLAFTTPLYCRILQPPWCDALASGQKMFEAQKYRGARKLNVFKFAAEGVMFLFGEAGSSKVAGAALLAGPAASNVSDAALQLHTQSLPSALQTPFQEYLRGAASVDIVEVKRVHGLRPLSLEWDQVSATFGCTISRNVGFTKIRATKPDGWQNFESWLADARVAVRGVQRTPS